MISFLILSRPQQVLQQEIQDKLLFSWMASVAQPPFFDV